MKKFSTRISILLFLMIVCATTAAGTTLVPGGQLVGLLLQDDTLTVTGVQEEEASPLQKGDKLLTVDGTPVHTPEDVRAALQDCGKQVSVTVRRGDKTKKLDVTPLSTADGPRLGIYLRQGTSGLGTVTFYDPDTGRFGALGHGVNDPSGQPLVLQGGSVFDASVLSVSKGQPGKPGQLLGQLQGETALGTVEKNVTQGIFGTAVFAPDQPLPVGDPAQVHTGSATIRSTVDSRGVQEYSVEIVKIYPNSGERTRNLLLRVTDERLLAATGGIVQGMSGSPIIQDGKLVGAVTHVLVNDPTTGYGIFIENMLDAAA